MSVLIKGMEKPDHCLRCPVKGIDDECLLQSEAANAEYESWEEQMANCPLFPIPPHGRLIDADKLVEIMTCHANAHGGMGGLMVMLAVECIAIAPTIIPAEEEATDG